MFPGVASTFPAQQEKFAGSFSRAPGTTAEAIRRPARGFSLIELMIVVAVVALLTAIGYPSYVQHITKANRSAAQGFLLTAANKQEQYMLDARQYAGSLSTLGLSVPTEVSKNYSISVSVDNSATPPSFTITATPNAGQLGNDAECANLTLDQTGSKGISGTGTVTGCW